MKFQSESKSESESAPNPIELPSKSSEVIIHDPRSGSKRKRDVIAAELKSKIRSIESARGRMIEKVIEIDLEEEEVKEEEDEEEDDEDDDVDGGYREEDMENRSDDDYELGSEGNRNDEGDTSENSGKSKIGQIDGGDKQNNNQKDAKGDEKGVVEEVEEDVVQLGGFESALLGKLILMYGVKDFNVLATMLGEDDNE